MPKNDYSSKDAHFDKDGHFSDDAHRRWKNARPTFEDAGKICHATVTVTLPNQKNHCKYSDKKRE